MQIVMDFTFEISYQDFIPRVRELAEEIVVSQHLPNGSIAIRANNGKTITTHSVCICEYPYPQAQGDVPSISSIVNIQELKSRADFGYVAIKIPDWLFNAVALPQDAVAEKKTIKGTSPYWLVKISCSSQHVIPYLRAIILYRLAYYVSAASPFGCCDLFEKCSDAKCCIHENRLYSTACGYRVNLEAGRIFYGKNRNI